MIEAYFNGTYVAPINYVNYKENEPVKETFISRKTANGANILDPSPAVVEMIKGKTVKSTNLIPFPYSFSDTTADGITIKKNDDGSITFTGTATVDWYVKITQFKVGELPIGTYYCSGSNEDVILVVDCYIDGKLVKNLCYGNKNFTVDFNGYDMVAIFVYIKKDKTVNDTIYPMLNEGSTAKPFVPYFSGLKHANFKRIKSTGKNLFNEPEFAKLSAVSIDTYDGEECYKFTPKKVNHIIPFVAKAGDKISYSLEVAVPTLAQLTIMFEDADGNSTDWMQDLNYSDSDGTYKKYAKTITLKKDCAYLNFRCYNRAGAPLYYLKNIMFNFGDAQSYESYKSDEYTDGNTYELAEYDYIDPQTGELVRQTETITLDGSKAWITDGENGEEVNGWYSKPTNWFVYNTYANDIVSTKSIRTNGALYNFLVKFPNGTTLEEVQAYYDGIVVAGKLRTPTIETLTDYPKEYTAYNGGSETVEQGETDNSQWGAICEITIQYFMPSEENILMLYDIFVKEE